ncbi:MAG: hypothetical protein ACXABY_13650 [Candidatus Thorarchaeota archaeon]|jgi:hypothetical protein
MKFPIVVNGEEELYCVDSLCGRKIELEEKYKLGPNGVSYCLPCGQCKEYELKREALRNHNNY